MSIFRLGDYVLASGQKSKWKIECDDLTEEDWQTLAVIASETVDLNGFSEIIGVPNGGVRFARALIERRGGMPGMPGAKAALEAISLGRQSVPKDTRPRLIVDDVLTTGKSIISMMDQSHDRGLVVFARGRLPTGVGALFRMRL